MTDSIDPGDRRPRRLFHGVWAALAIAATILLVSVDQTGHPPPMILVPPVLILWLIGHAVIAGAQWLALRGRENTARSGGPPPPWPIGLGAALLATGAASLVGIVQVVASALLREWYPFHEIGLWTVMLLVWLLHGLCFVGLLLRHAAARLLAAALAIGWALLLAAQVPDSFRTGAAVDTSGLFLTFALIVALVLFALHLGVSAVVKSFFRR